MSDRAGDTPEGRELLAQWFEYQNRRFAQPAKDRAALYGELLIDRQKRKSHLRLTYKAKVCRCHLLHVFSTPQGILIGFPPRRPGAEAGRGGVIYVGREAERARAEWLAEWLAVQPDGQILGERDELRCPHFIAEIGYADIKLDLATHATRGHKVIPLPRTPKL